MPVRPLNDSKLHAVIMQSKPIPEDRDTSTQPPDPGEDKGTDLVFISQIGPDRPKSSRTQIRKHVMKNIGKARRKASLHRKLAVVHMEAMERARDATSSALELMQYPEGVVGQYGILPVHHANTKARAIPPTARQFPNLAASERLWSLESGQGSNQIERLWTERLDPFFKYPVEVDINSFQLLDHLLDERYGNTPPFRDLWLPVGLFDPAGFYQMLCNATVNLSSLYSRAVPVASQQALGYHAKAIQSINQRISNAAVVKSDGFLATIIGLSCYFHATGDLSGWRLHRDGAAEIIRLRGGVKTIEQNPQLGILFFWTENAGAITLDVPPLSPIPYKLLPTLLDLTALAPLSPQAIQIRNAWTWILPNQPRLMLIMNEMRGFTTYLHSQAALTSGKVYSHGLTAASYMVPILHKLLALAAPDVDARDERNNLIQAVRLSCCLFFTEIRRLFGIMGIQTALQTAKLKRLLEASANVWSPFGLLKVWCITVGGLESAGEEREWYHAELEKGRETLGLHSWEEVHQELKGVLWYECVHDTLFREFCSRDEVQREASTHGSRFGG